jgi:starch synthase
MRRTPRRSVLFIASEAQPFAKSGGLADVAGALPPALARLGWDVTVALPRYRGVNGGELLEEFTVTIGGIPEHVRFLEAPMPSGARALLVDCPNLYDRDALYGHGNVDFTDNPRRFALLTRAALEFGGRTRRPDVVHAHDWQAALAPVYLRTLYAAHPVLAGTPTVLTIHNLAFQGNFEPDWLPRLDLGWDQFTVPRMEFWGRISFLKGGIVDADMITTVSPTYASEIQTPSGGFGFDGSAFSTALIQKSGIRRAMDTCPPLSAQAIFQEKPCVNGSCWRAMVWHRRRVRSSAWYRAWWTRRGSI